MDVNVQEIPIVMNVHILLNVAIKKGDVDYVTTTIKNTLKGRI